MHVARTPPQWKLLSYQESSIRLPSYVSAAKPLLIRAVYGGLWQGGSYPDSRAGVVHVALGVPEACFVVRLRRCGGVPRTYEDLVIPRREVDGDLPVAPGPRPEVVKQLGL